MVAITIATDVLSVGWDSQSTEDAIILGEPADVDEFVQKIGRIRHNRWLVSHPRGILYYTRGALATAQSLIDNHLPIDPDEGEHGQPTINPPSKKGDQEMDISMAGLLLAKCKPTELNSIYDNPESDPECTCGICRTYPPVRKPAICTCSGPYCRPESPPTAPAVPTAVISKKTKSKKREGINKELRALATAELKSLRQRIFNDASASEYGFFPPSIFLPDETIKEIIDKLYSVQTVGDVHSILQGNQLLNSREEEVLSFCESLHNKFAEHHAEAKHKKKETLQEGTSHIEDDEHAESGSDEDDILINEVTRDGETGEVEEINIQRQKNITWRIHMQYVIYIILITF